jgi:uncharacterized protein (DUF1697 family)
MVRYVAFLRGINVGKTNRVNVRDIATAIGRSFTDVRTYGQSGNFVFSGDIGKEDVASAVESNFENEFGFSVPCVVRTIDELQSIVDRNPFRDADADQSFFVLMKEGTSGKRDEWENNGDAAKRIGDVVYLRCVGPYHKTKLSNGFFEKELGVPCTVRNRNTMNAMLRL